MATRITAEQLAAELQLTASDVEELIVSGDLIAEMIDEVYWIDQVDFDRFLDSARVRPGELDDAPIE